MLHNIDSSNLNSDTFHIIKKEIRVHIVQKLIPLTWKEDLEKSNIKQGRQETGTSFVL
jgi:hypothetical protein